MVASSSGKISSSGQGAVRQAGPGARLADNAFQLHHPWVGDLVVHAADVDVLQLGTVVEVLGEALQSLGVHDGDRGP